ncbi:phage virion morphogenesis protein [Fulvimarina endophytica]|uniref:Phage virion morphogenesis protein n=1 Tax=Fulvimarina endophytica TaxID=2293836 RepID=A0A371X321_9HYPH|nr:phage virion morphogenesis protein [Fulvimarina endophytica]RFC63612.1 phage virion morphogenesis protein [Fulvimarina endophytica]
MAASISITAQVLSADVERAFARLISVMDDTTPVMAAIGTQLVSSTHRRFVSQHSPDGTPWKKLNPDYARTKRNRRILTESGRLRDSINSKPGRDSVRVGTNTVYAAAHQFGVTIKPKTKSHLVFRLASGVVLAKSVTLPARPFLGISSQDEDEIAEVVFGFLVRRAGLR